MLDTVTERWAHIPGYEGMYSVSDHGRVRSEDRIEINAKGRRAKRQGRLLKAGMSQGRLLVALSCAGKRHTGFVHRLVALAFLGPRPDGMEVCHNDGNPLNNRLDNLRYDTHAGNMADMVAHGTRMRVARQRMAELREEEINSIRRRWEAGEKQAALAVEFGAKKTTIQAICGSRARPRADRSVRPVDVILVTHAHEGENVKKKKPNRTRPHELHCPVSPEERAHLAAFALADDRPLSIWALRVALGLPVSRKPKPYKGTPGEVQSTTIHFQLSAEDRETLRAKAGGPIAPWLRTLLLGERTTSTPAPRKVRTVAEVEA